MRSPDADDPSAVCVTFLASSLFRAGRKRLIRERKSTMKLGNIWSDHYPCTMWAMREMLELAQTLNVCYSPPWLARHSFPRCWPGTGAWQQTTQKLNIIRTHHFSFPSWFYSGFWSLWQLELSSLCLPRFFFVAFIEAFVRTQGWITIPLTTSTSGQQAFSSASCHTKGRGLLPGTYAKGSIPFLNCRSISLFLVSQLLYWVEANVRNR